MWETGSYYTQVWDNVVSCSLVGTVALALLPDQGSCFVSFYAYCIRNNTDFLEIQTVHIQSNLCLPSANLPYPSPLASHGVIYTTATVPHTTGAAPYLHAFFVGPQRVAMLTVSLEVEA